MTVKSPSSCFIVLSTLLGCLLVVGISDAFGAPRLASRIHNEKATASSLPRRPLFAVASPQGAIIEDFLFQGHKTYVEVYKPTGTSKPKNKNCHVILIHGFGCSTAYWRETIRLLQENGYTLHTLDLLGQGKSDKPGRADGIAYSIRLWAQQVDDYARANIPPSCSIVTMGNSLGSVVALATATGDQAADPNSGFIRQSIRGVGMFNCGVGMNSRNILKEFSGWQLTVFTALFDLLDAIIFGNLALLTYVLDKVVTKELLKNALASLYQFATDVDDRVNDALVDSFYYPAKDPGSPETLSQIYINDPGDTPMEICDRYASFLEAQVPVHLVWGTQDAVTPLAGPVGVFFQSKARDPSATNISMDLIEAGHIPFDEVPASNELMLTWLDRINSSGNVGTTSGKSNPFNLKIPFFRIERG